MSAKAAAQGFCVHAATLHGARALPVTVEVSISTSIPGFTIVGMPDSEVLEARYRVRCALKESGYQIPRMHFTFNLAPGEVRKSGTGFDLPMAVALLASTGQIPLEGLDSCLFVGELGLKGMVGMVRGQAAFEGLAHERSLTLVCAGDALLPGDGAVLKLEDLSRLRLGVADLPAAPRASGEAAGKEGGHALDFADVVDQDEAKRACVIAAAGGLGLLMVGPPGAGKTMLARRMPTILPPLSEEERAEAMVIHSVCGEPAGAIARGERPFRAPHHSVSVAGLIGGGRPVRPGEASLAHHGVLFLDELSEFANNTLQALRQPLEDHEVRLVRADGVYSFPCDFQLVAASNPCPCGHLGDPGHVCQCSEMQVRRYQSKIGGPLMDRIDVLVHVGRPDSGKVLEGSRGLTSAEMASMVAAAREFSSWRRATGRGMAAGAGGRAGEVVALAMSDGARSRFEAFATHKGLGGRAMVRVARVARTVADLAEHEEIEADDIIEACAYRAAGR